MMTGGLGVVGPGVVGVDGPHVGGAAGFMGVAMELPASRTMMSSAGLNSTLFLLSPGILHIVVNPRTPQTLGSQPWHILLSL